MKNHISWMGQFISQPGKTAALIQASPVLAREMAERATCNWTQDKRIVELGCGYGAITRALLDKGVPPSQMISVDISRRSVEMTRKLGAQALCVDARYLTYLLRDINWQGCHCVVSSLGLLSMNAELRNKILDQVNEILLPGGRFVQYTYGWGDPTYGQAHRLGWKSAGKDFVLRNIPPAHVLVWTKPVDPVLR